MNAQVPTVAERIEGKLDKEIAGGLSMSSGGTAITIAPRNMGELMEFAKMMSLGGPAIRPAFRNNPGACLALTLQAMRWGMDPIAVCNKAYITTGKGGEQIAFEAQLIHAVVNERAPLARRLRPEYTGEGAQRRCVVNGWLKGEPEPLTYTSPPFSSITPKNSPLWTSDPDQQHWYYSVRAWARKHVPEVLLGVYTEDEIEQGPDRARDITPPPMPRRADFANGGAATPALADHGKDASKEAAEPESLDLVSAIGEIVLETTDQAIWAERFDQEMTAAVVLKALETLWENNSPYIGKLPDALADEVRETYQKREAEIRAADRDAGERQAGTDEAAAAWEAKRAALWKIGQTFEARKPLSDWFQTDPGVAEIKSAAPDAYAALMTDVNARHKTLRK